MRRNRAIAAVAAAVVTLGLGVVGATSATAADDGPRQTGNVYFLKNDKNLATASAADQVTDGSYASQSAFTSVAVDGRCPSGTVQVQVYTRLKNTQPEEFWDEIAIGATRPYSEDAQGNAYIVAPFDNFNLAAIQNHLGGSAKDLPVAFVCKDTMATPLGYFETDVTVGTLANGTWSQVSPTLITGGGQQAADTTLTLSGIAVGANLALTATVNPEAAAGTVAFSEGGVSLGSETVSDGRATVTVVAPTDGDHTYTATFTPSDPARYNGSTTQATFNVAVQPDGSIVVTLVVPGAEPGEPGTVTLSVQRGAVVELIGQRATGNTRVTASGDLPTVTVTDTHRSDLLTEWQVNVQATDFTNGSATIAAKYLGLIPDMPSTTGLDGPATVVYRGPTVASAMDDAASAGMSQGQPLGMVATKGRGVTTLGGTLNLAVPGASAAEGSYSSVVTVTLVNG